MKKLVVLFLLLFLTPTIKTNTMDNLASGALICLAGASILSNTSVCLKCTNKKYYQYLDCKSEFANLILCTLLLPLTIYLICKKNKLCFNPTRNGLSCNKAIFSPKCIALLITILADWIIEFNNGMVTEKCFKQHSYNLCAKEFTSFAIGFLHILLTCAVLLKNVNEYVYAEENLRTSPLRPQLESIQEVDEETE